jgi:hypothetical protein
LKKEEEKKASVLVEGRRNSSVPAFLSDDELSWFSTITKLEMVKDLPKFSVNLGRLK